MREPVITYIGLGANLGDAQAALHDAIAELRRLPSTLSLRTSRLWRSAPVDASGPDFVNAVAELRTTLSALELLRQLQAIESGAGRQRPYRNAPRTLDLDLLLYGSARIASAALTVPHPRLRERAFVLHPLRELAPELVSEAELAAVAGQQLSPLPPTSSPG
jgi:2-amino-4-hydroxy-6-hydroxymethyldihydropteridine diphosphokinase